MGCPTILPRLGWRAILECRAGPCPPQPPLLGGRPRGGLHPPGRLGTHASLVEPRLHGAEADAVQALLSYAARLGALHTDTIGQEVRFTRLWHTLIPQGGSVAHEVERLAEQMLLLQRHV